MARIRRLRIPRTLLRGEEPPFALRADGGKLGRTAHAYVGPSTLVTDATAPADEVAALEGTGTVVKTA